MTLSVAMGPASPAMQPKTADTGKTAEPADHRFRDAIENRNGKRAKTAEMPPAEAEARPVNALERLMAKFGIEEDAGEVPQEEHAVLDQEGEAAMVAVDAVVDKTPVRTGPIANEDTRDDVAGKQGGEDADLPAVRTENGRAETNRSAEQQRDLPRATQDDMIAARTAEGGRQGAVSSAATTAATTTTQPPVIAPQQKQAGDTQASGNRASQQQGSGTSALATEGDADTPAQRPAPIPAASSGNGNGGIRDDARSGDGNPRPSSTANDAVQSRVNVLGFTAAVAPASTANPLLGTTAAGVVAAMEGEATWRSATIDSAVQNGQRGTPGTTGVNTLRIQLNPAELGTVTARLTAAGDQLSVEIEVETTDARQRLTSDSDSILKALRAIGYDIDKVVITQSSPNASGTAQQGTAGREQFASNQQAQGEDAATGRDGGRGAGRQDGEASRHASGENTADHAGGSLYI